MAQDNPVSIACYVIKGGVTKTTTAAHMGVALSNLGFDTVIIDLAGKQDDLTAQFGLEEETSGDLEVPVSGVFEDLWDQLVDQVPDVADRMMFSSGEGPRIIPEDAGLSAVDSKLANVDKEERFTILRDRLVDGVLAGEADFVLFDLPGADSNVALNGLGAADHVVAPICPGRFEEKQLNQLEEDLEKFRDSYDDIQSELRMVLPTKIMTNRNLSQDFLNAVEEEYPDTVAPTHVPHTQEIPNRQREGKTLFAVDEGDLYDTGVRARNAYTQATKDFVKRVGMEVPADV